MTTQTDSRVQHANKFTVTCECYRHFILECLSEKCTGEEKAQLAEIEKGETAFSKLERLKGSPAIKQLLNTVRADSPEQLPYGHYYLARRLLLCGVRSGGSVRTEERVLLPVVERGQLAFHALCRSHRAAADIAVETVRSIKQGDQRAYQRLCDKYRKAVEGYIKRHVNNYDDAQDVLAATCNTLWERRNTYDPGRASPHSFACYQAGLRLKDLFRSKELWNRLHVLASEMISDYPEMSDEDVFDWIAAKTQGHQEMVSEETYLDVQEYIFDELGEPHKQLAYGFTQTLNGWPPHRFVAELSDFSLRDAAILLVNTYIRQSKLPPERVDKRMFRGLAKHVLENETLGRQRIVDFYHHKEPGDRQVEVSRWAFEARRRGLCKAKRDGLIDEKPHQQRRGKDDASTSEQ